MINPTTLRTEALKWWRGLGNYTQAALAKKHLPAFVDHCFVTGLQIEIMYLAENEIEA